jgi:hypothetical protein
MATETRDDVLEVRRDGVVLRLEDAASAEETEDLGILLALMGWEDPL